MDDIVIKEWFKKSKIVLMISLLSSLFITALSLLRLQQGISPVPEIIQSGRGYPLIFLVDTTRSLLGTPLGLSVIPFNLLVDIMVWALIAFIIIVTIRIALLLQSRNY